MKVIYSTTAFHLMLVGSGICAEPATKTIPQPHAEKKQLGAEPRTANHDCTGDRRLTVEQPDRLFMPQAANTASQKYLVKGFVNSN